MARPRTGNKSEVIVEGALKCFNDLGVGATTMETIAHTAKVAVGTLYLYFKDKEALISACADKFAQAHFIDVQLLHQRAESSQTLLIEYHLKRYTEWCRLNASSGSSELVLEIARLRPDRVKEYQSLSIETTERLIMRGIERGEFKNVNPKKAAEFLFTSLLIFFPLPNQRTFFQPKKLELKKCLSWFVEVGLQRG